MLAAGVLFWLAVVWVVYANIGYLILLYILPKPRRRQASQCDITPSVSLIIAAHNEQTVIASKLDNTLGLDYPRDRLEIIVASDGSTDRTNEIVTSYSPKGVRLNALAERRGKVAVLNVTVPMAHGEILVFSDADSTYDSQALRKLVRHFADPRVGAVTGEEKRIQEATSRKGLGESLYVRLDNLVKRLDGEFHSMVMVNGGFFAVRRELYPFVPPHLTHDATVPAYLCLQGYRTAYEPEAVSVEVYPLTAHEDFGRRLRTISRACYSYLSVRAALNPFRTGVFAFQVLSHRFSRWLVLPFLILALVTNFFLASVGLCYRVALGIQIALYCLALVGFILDFWYDKRIKLFYVPYYFVYIFTAAFIAILLAVLGQRITSWQPTKRTA